MVRKKLGICYFDKKFKNYIIYTIFYQAYEQNH